MLFFAGALLLALGLLSGLVLLLAPFGLVGMAPGYTLWLMFPLLSLVGYAVVAVQAGFGQIRTVSIVAAGVLLVLALGAVVALVLGAAQALPAPASTAPLWFVLVVGFVLGSTVSAAYGRLPDDPAARR